VDRLRSTLAAPGGARTVGVLVALVGVALLIVGVVALGGGGSGSSGAAPAPAPVTPSASARPSSARPSATASRPSASRAPTATRPAPSAGTTAAPPRPTTAPPPATPPRAPLTVLNNSTIKGLADRAATAVQDRGWQVAQVGNFAGRLVATTVYFSPGNSVEEAAARELAREFPQVTQVLPRYAGLPPTPAGIVLVITKDWS
jgi:LytR cell envelope-related transcriptional attenuator